MFFYCRYFFLCVAMCNFRPELTPPCSPNLDQFDDNLIKEYGAKYLNVGEYVFDASVGYFTTSTYFKRK